MNPAGNEHRHPLLSQRPPAVVEATAAVVAEQPGEITASRRLPRRGADPTADGRGDSPAPGLHPARRPAPHLGARRHRAPRRRDWDAVELIYSAERVGRPGRVR